MRSRGFIWLAFVAGMVGCQSAPSPAPSGKLSPPDRTARPVETEPLQADAFTLTDATNPVPAWISDGLIGLRVGRTGLVEADGAFWHKRYQPDGEEKIIPLPSPLAQDVLIRSRSVRELPLSNYRQTVDFRSPSITTEYAADGVAVKHTVQIGADGHISESWEAPSLLPNDFKVTLPDKAALEKAFEETITQRVSTSESTQYVRVEIGEHRARPVPRKLAIQIEGPDEDQRKINSMLHYLTSSIHPDQQYGSSPFALSNTQYNGHTFWDADIWVFPALMLLDRPRADRIMAYRVERLDQAKRNFQQWVTAGRPVGNSRSLGPLNTTVEAAKFPWESSVTGRETVPGPSRFQDHITGSVAFAFHWAQALSLPSGARANEIRDLAGKFFESRTIRTGRGDEIQNTMSPDENHTGNNDLYTNLLAAWSRRQWGADRPNKFTYVLPKDQESFLTYDDDPVRGYKQAAAELAVYPLQFPEAERQAMTITNRFAPRVTKNGPAMSTSVSAIIHARFGEADTAYEMWQSSNQDFLNGPFLLYSEKRARPLNYFVTGAGGALQTVLYGFCGIRIDRQKSPYPLANGNFLHIRPNLPSAWKSVTIDPIRIGPKPMRLTIRGKEVTLTPRGDIQTR